MNTITPSASRKLRRKYILVMVGWSVLIGVSLAWNLKQEADETISMAVTTARSSISKDILFRKWVALHGGVYVPPTEKTPPNPYLKVPNRDVVTTTGKTLTLMNPAYALRELQILNDDPATKTHITSLRLLNPHNTADEWESAALKSFEQGSKEAMEVTQFDGQHHLRLMRPFIVAPECLKCHEQQGYKVGDIRGGISADVSLETFQADEQNRDTPQLLTHGLVWLVGIVLGMAFHRRERYLEAEREQFETALTESEERWKFALEGAGEGGWDWNCQTGETLFSPRYKEMLGFSDSDIWTDASEWENRIHPDDLSAVLESVQEHMDGKTTSTSNEFRMLCKDGNWKWVLGRGMVVSRSSDGKPLRLVGTTTDITSRKQMDEQVRQLAYFDALTQLPNLRMLDDRLSQTMAQSKRSGCYGALLFIDLDNFKPLNDQYGHPTGDLLLIEVAKRLTGIMREMDTVARFGGDEFVVMLSELDLDKAESTSQANIVAEKIRALLAEPYHLTIQQQGRAESVVEHHCTSSIGVVLFVNHEASAEDLLKWADLAMYQAKENGRNAIRFFDQQSGSDTNGVNRNVVALRLKWHESYKCNEPTIDQEHRELFNLANTLIASAFAKNENSKDFDSAMAKLLAHIVQHFAHEETILSQYHYAELDAHKHAHKLLIVHALHLRDKANAGLVTIGELVSFIADEVIAQHLLKEDRNFYPLFNEGQLSRS